MAGKRKKAKKKTGSQESTPRIKEKKSELVKTIQTLSSRNEQLETTMGTASKQILELEESKTSAEESFSQKKESLKKEINTTGIKIAVSALAITLVSICSLFLIASSQNSHPVLNILFASGLVCLGSMIIVFAGNYENSAGDGFTVSVICGIILGVIGGTYIKGAYSRNDSLVYLVYIVSSVTFFIVITYASYKKTKKGFSHLRAFLLSLIFLAVCGIGIIPLSKYRNLNQIEHDKRIVEMLQITSEPNGIEVLLPAEHVSEQRYMEQVLAFKWPGQEVKETPLTTWNDSADYCCEGKKEWYKAKLDFPLRKSTVEFEAGRKEKIFQRQIQIILFFNHAWEDYEITIKIPDPNGSSS